MRYVKEYGKKQSEVKYLIRNRRANVEGEMVEDLRGKGGEENRD